MALWNERIRERRLELELTLLQVAEQLGVSEATVQRYESGGIKNIPYDAICRLSNILSCSPSYLMGWEQSKEGSRQTRRIISQLESNDFTEDEIAELERYIEFLKSKKQPPT